ncbi:MAG: nucleoside phosphorylase [Bacteroidia bacterium]
MLKQLTPSELIVNKDGSVYHLGLLPSHVYPTVITVGDPDRVDEVSKYFDKIDFEIQNREFKTVGGACLGKKITVISTGIGTDNIDIVFNELAFLVNYDLKTLKPFKTQTSIDIIRLGTSGSISSENELNSIVYSKNVVSLDDLFQYYDHSFDIVRFADLNVPVIDCSSSLEEKFKQRFNPSLTITAKGFYGPQFRNAQIQPKYSLEDVYRVSYEGVSAGNIEMETAGIYGLAKLLGFQAISINAILADRRSNEFSKNPQETIQQMIKESLELICK